MLAELFTLTPDLIAALVAAAFVAGFIDAIAGGGGLIVVPALMLAGQSPAEALATNKVQAGFGTLAAVASYARKGLVRPRTQALPALIAFAAGALGAVAVTVLPVAALRMALPVVLIGLALFFALRKGLDDTDRTARMTPALFMLTLVPAVGFYDGLLGPGAGAFYMIGFVTLAGYGLLRATAHTKVLNLASNLGALAGFAASGQPAWALGLVMGLAALAGAALGARAAMAAGARLIRPLLVVTSAAMALRLLAQQL